MRQRKIKALDAATQTLDAKHLNDSTALQFTLRELIRIAPNDLQFMFRLSRVQEEQGEIEAAEDTLLAAHRQQPQELDPTRCWRSSMHDELRLSQARWHRRRDLQLRQIFQAHPTTTGSTVWAEACRLRNVWTFHAIRQTRRPLASAASFSLKWS
jgi:hypothetical protein